MCVKQHNLTNPCTSEPKQTHVHKNINFSSRAKDIFLTRPQEMWPLHPGLDNQYKLALLIFMTTFAVSDIQ